MATSTDVASAAGTAAQASASRRGHRMRGQLRDLPVGRKLAIGFGSLTTVLMLVVVCVFLAVNRLGVANDEIVFGAGARARAAAHLRFAAAEMRAAQQAYVLGWPASHAEFDRVSARFERELRALRARSDDATEQALVQKLTTSYQTFLATDQLIGDALRNGEATLARHLTLGPESLAFGFIADDAQQYADLTDADRLEAVSRFRATSVMARRLALAFGSAALLVMSVAGWLITRVIRDPLLRVQQAAERAADGDLHAEADVHGDDETGRVARAFNTMLAKLRAREEALLADHKRQETTNKVQRAFEMADDEPAALEVVGLTLADVLPGRSAELLLADNSKANLEQAVVSGGNPAGPGCPVASPFSCVAVRTGAAVTFASSDALDACPHLRNRGVEECSAVCVPVSFMGRAMGVIHAVDEPRRTATPAEIESLTMLSAQSGTRVGMLRTMLRTHEQASTDSLTGLMNRRTFQARIRSLRRAGAPFALVMADIDHFKRVNDTYGHETGDRALKTFSEVARSTLRQGDLLARWGGEEFAFAFAGLDAAAAQNALDRIRLELAARLSTSDLPAFTASFGVVEASACPTLEVAVRLADDALYEAKANGRNCSVVADTALAAGVEVAVPQARVRERADRPDASAGVLAALAGDDDPTEA